MTDNARLDQTNQFLDAVVNIVNLGVYEDKIVVTGGQFHLFSFQPVTRLAPSTLAETPGSFHTTTHEEIPAEIPAEMPAEILAEIPAEIPAEFVSLKYTIDAFFTIL